MESATAADLPMSADVSARRVPFFLHDPDGVPVAGVSISLVGRTGAVVTGADGSFRLVPEPIPPFQIVVIALDGALLGTIYVPALDDPSDRRLVLSHSNIETIQVLSGVAPGSDSPPASGASVLSRGELERLRATRLVDAIVEVPGANRSGSGQTAVPSFRGMARGRTLVLLDGARVTTERRAGASATFLDPFSLGSVELVRGPGSVAYGSDALGGVIHARTPLPEPGVTFVDYEAAAGAGLEYASFGARAQIALGRGAVLAQFHQRSFDDYRSPRGTVDNSSARDSGGLVRGLVPIGAGRIDIGLQINRARDLSRPTEEPDPSRTVYPLEDSDRLTLAYDLPGVAGFSGFELRGFVGRYRLITERVTVDKSTSTTSISQSDVEAGDASLKFIAVRPGGRGLLRLGIDLVSRFGLKADDRIVDHPSGGPPVVVLDQETIRDARRFDAALFVEGEHAPGSGVFSLSAGIRGDTVSTRNSGGSFG
ncbi:MAG: TonB-dependent receptor plug domain-containing protein, partial [Acidobacteriota bacterium]